MSRVPRVVLRRLPWLVVVIVGITTLTFIIANIVPADPARAAAGVQATEEQVATMRERMGLDQPLTVQYVRYLDRLVHGDLGTVPTTSRPVRDDLIMRFPATLELVLVTIVPTAVFGVLLGVVAALHPRSALDRVIQVISLTSMAMPRFWVAIVLQIIFFGILGWFPTIGRLSLGITPPERVTGLYLVDSLIRGQWHTFIDALWHIILPATALALTGVASVIRVARVSLLETLASDYVRTARAKGLAEHLVIYRHALRNAAIPIITTIGLQAGFLFSGAVVIEIVFGWPGIGEYAVNSIINLYFQPIMGVTLTIAVVFVFINLCVDILYTLIDPRVSV